MLRSQCNAIQRSITLAGPNSGAFSIPLSHCRNDEISSLRSNGPPSASMVTSCARTVCSVVASVSPTTPRSDSTRPFALTREAE